MPLKLREGERAGLELHKQFIQEQALTEQRKSRREARRRELVFALHLKAAARRWGAGAGQNGSDKSKGKPGSVRSRRRSASAAGMEELDPKLSSRVAKEGLRQRGRKRREASTRR